MLRGEGTGEWLLAPGERFVVLTRAPSPQIAACQLTHLERRPIDFERLLRQHQAYCRALEAWGCRVVTLEADPTFPDGVFVEDTAVVLDEIAVLTRPGAPSRELEVDAIAPRLAPLRSLHRIQAPATLDGGDVVRLGRTLFVGASTRTNSAGREALAAIVAPFGYEVVAVEVRGSLHLKTAVTAVADEVLLVNRRWIDVAPFAGYELVDVAEQEPFAANALRIGAKLLAAAEHQRTLERLRRRGFEPHTIDFDELAKAEAGLTCCSIVVDRVKDT